VEWIDLLTPSAAVLALFFSIALVVQAWRHSRAIRRIEQRLASNGTAGAEAPLERIVELQQRITTSQGVRPRAASPGYSDKAVLATITAAILVLGAGGWYFFLRDGGSGTAGGGANTTAQTGPAATTSIPVDPTAVPANPPDVDPGTVTVALFNASGVEGAARNVVSAQVEQFGYVLGVVENPPDGTSDLTESVVQFAKGKRGAGANVAKDLGIETLVPIEGLTPEQTGDADVVVLVGLDLANG
jgi:LytR cell envelope-related transcriptional attenuator